MKNYLLSVLKLPRAILFFIATELVLGLGLGMWNLSFNLYLSASGVSSGEIGRISSVGPLTTALLAVLCGYLCDRIGYKKSMIAGCFFKVAGMFLTCFSGDGIGLYLARILNGTGDCFILVSEYPYIMAMADEKMRSTVYSIFFSTTLLASFLGNIAGGVLKGFVDSYGSILLISCFFMAAITAVRGFLPDMKVAPPTIVKGIYIPKSKDFTFYLIYNLLGYAVYFFAYSMLNLILKNRMGLTDYSVGLVSGVLLLGAGVSTFFTPLMVRKVDRCRLSACILALLALLYVFAAFSEGFWFIFFIMVTGFMQNMLVGLVDGPMLNAVPEGEKGGFSGLKFFLSQGGNSLGVFFAGLLLDCSDAIKWMYLIACAGMVIQVFLFILGFQKRLARIT